jgi:hypothetical protein
VRKEADTTVAAGSILAEASAVLRRVKPALEHPMSILTHVATPAHAFPEVRAWHTAVVILARIPAAGVLPRVHEGALGPVMRVRPGARPDLEGVHPELIRGVDAVLDIRQGGIHRVFLLL